MRATYQFLILLKSFGLFFVAVATGKFNGITNNNKKKGKKKKNENGKYPLINKFYANRDFFGLCSES